MKPSSRPVLLVNLPVLGSKASTCYVSSVQNWPYERKEGKEAGGINTAQGAFSL